MRKASSLPGMRWRSVIFPLVALVIVCADQLSKLWLKANLAPGETLFEAGIFRITHVHNTGAAFGLFQDQSFALTIVALLGAALILVCALFMCRFPPLNGMWGKLALGLILGGTIGNLVDRFRLGYVVDFIDIGWWPAFNLADSALVVGAIILALTLLPLARTGKW